MEFFFNKLIELFPQIGGYLAGIFIVGFLVYKGTKFYMETRGNNKLMPTIQTSLQKIDSGLKTLNQVLVEKSVITLSCYTESNSPRSVNDLGKRLFKESHAEEVFNQISNDLIQALEQDKSIDSLLEIERTSVGLLLNRMNNPEFKEIQNYVYEHPLYEGNPLTYTDIIFIMGLKLRDLYMEKHPLAGTNKAQSANPDKG